LYRSAQLSPKRFKNLILRKKIKTVINFRGANKEEEDICSALKIKYISIPMSSGQLPNPKNLAKLVDSFRLGERPIYIHCLGGADRTGEAAAIYKLMEGKSKKEALRQLTPYYLHFPFVKPAKRFFIEILWQGESWAKNKYTGLTDKE